MKLKIVFLEPSEKEIKTSEDEKVIVIRSPYKIIQTQLGDTREYEKSDGSKMSIDFTYEQYCQEMSELIDNTLDKSGMADHVYDMITIEGFNQPPHFKAVCSKIEKTSIFCASDSKIIFKDCSFGGTLYADSARKLVRSIQKRHSEHNQKKVAFEMTLTDQGKVSLSKHDEARLAMLKDVVYRNNDKSVSVKTFRDDSLIGVKKSPLISKLKAPTLFYSNAMNTMQGQTASEMVLKNFFSQEAQQQSDFTCGPATVKMVANYFDSMRYQNFCDAPVANQKVWHKINRTRGLKSNGTKTYAKEVPHSSITDLERSINPDCLVLRQCL